MALGRQGGRQAELMVGWAELPRSPGHVFYDRLQTILVGAEFDRFAENACAPYYAGRRGRPSLPLLFVSVAFFFWFFSSEIQGRRSWEKRENCTGHVCESSTQQQTRWARLRARWNE